MCMEDPPAAQQAGMLAPDLEFLRLKAHLQQHRQQPFLPHRPAPCAATVAL